MAAAMIAKTAESNVNPSMSADVRAMTPTSAMITPTMSRVAASREIESQRDSSSTTVRSYREAPTSARETMLEENCEPHDERVCVGDLGADGP